MINIKVYKNGYEIIGHAIDSICSQISLWHWTASNLLTGLDNTAKEYASVRDNKDNPNEGYSWCVYTPDDGTIQWIFDDLIINIERWAEEFCKRWVTVEHIEGLLEK